MKRILTFSLLFLLLITAQTYAQDTLKIADPTLSGQYKLLLQSKNNAQGLKLINPASLQSFHKNLSDSLSSSRRNLAEAQSKLSVQNKTINALNADLKAKEENLSKSENMVDNIKFLGMAINKSTYNMMMWGCILLLAAVLAFTLYQSQSYRKEAHYRIKLFDDLSAEYQSYKIKANDKEKRLARELQTEKNRVDELR